MSEGSLGLGESYMDEWWTVERLDQFFSQLLGGRIDRRFRNLQDFIYHLRARIFNQQTRLKSKRVARMHYDLGNDFYRTRRDT